MPGHNGTDWIPKVASWLTNDSIPRSNVAPTAQTTTTRTTVNPTSFTTVRTQGWQLVGQQAGGHVGPHLLPIGDRREDRKRQKQLTDLDRPTSGRIEPVAGDDLDDDDHHHHNDREPSEPGKETRDRLEPRG